MPKHIPEATKLEAMTLFLEGNKTAKEIAEVISKDGVVVTPPTIYSWAKKNRWGEQKDVARYDKQKELVETEVLSKIATKLKTLVQNQKEGQ